MKIQIPMNSLALLLEIKAERDREHGLESMMRGIREHPDSLLKSDVLRGAAQTLEVDLA